MCYVFLNLKVGEVFLDSFCSKVLYMSVIARAKIYLRENRHFEYLYMNFEESASSHGRITCG